MMENITKQINSVPFYIDNNLSPARAGRQGPYSCPVRAWVLLSLFGSDPFFAVTQSFQRPSQAPLFSRRMGHRPRLPLCSAFQRSLRSLLEHLSSPRHSQPLQLHPQAPRRPLRLVPTATATSIPSATATASPVPTATNPPPTATATSVSSVEIIAVNKPAEYVEIQNFSQTPVNLRGWRLVSETGNQSCNLRGTLAPNAVLRIWARRGNPGFDCQFPNDIWRDNQADPAVLYNPQGEEVSRFP